MKIEMYDIYDRSNISDLRELIAIRAGERPEGVAFQYKKKGGIVNVTAQEFVSDVDMMTSYIRRNYGEGQKIAVLGENGYFWIVSYLATILSGNVVIPLDKDRSADELSELLSECDVLSLFCASSYKDIALNLQERGTVSGTVILEDIPDLIRELSDEGVRPGKVCNTDPDKVCSILFTSGTTGKSKGVMLSQRNIVADAMNSVRRIWKPGSDGTTVLTLPLHHSFGMTIGVLALYLCGFPIYISTNIRHFVDDLNTAHPFVMVVVPLYVEIIYKRIWSEAREMGLEKKLRRGIKISNLLLKIGIDMRRVFFKKIHEKFGGSLRYLICGGAFLDQDYIDGLEDIGITTLNGYGISECSPVVSVNMYKHAKDNSIGLPIPGCEIRINEGEILVRGDNVMLGYYNDPEGTKEAFDNGWFCTGDLGHLDADGYLYMTGRKKNLIILSNGENVSAEELEMKLLRIDGVEEVIVEEENKKIVAKIYTLEGSDGRELIDRKIDALNRTLPPYKRIGKVVYRDEEFKKTTTQKIIRLDGKTESA